MGSAQSIVVRADSSAQRNCRHVSALCVFDGPVVSLQPELLGSDHRLGSHCVCINVVGARQEEIFDVPGRPYDRESFGIMQFQQLAEIQQGDVQVIPCLGGVQPALTQGGLLLCDFRSASLAIQLHFREPVHLQRVN